MIKGTGIAIAGLLAASGAAQPAGAAKPQPARAVQDLYHYFTADDYPEEALRRHATGVVAFRLTIDDRGAVSNCAVESSSGDPDLDRVTCEILGSRARYYPARDSEGRAIEGSDMGRVTWRLPPQTRPPETLPLTTGEFAGTLSSNGSRLACSTTVNGDAAGPTAVPMCELLIGAGGGEILRRLVPGTEFSAVLRVGMIASRAPARDALFASAARVTITPDGRVSACAPLGRLAPPPPGFRRLPSPCALFRPGERKYFPGEPARAGPRTVAIELRFSLNPRPPERRP